MECWALIPQIVSHSHPTRHKYIYVCKLHKNYNSDPWQMPWIERTQRSCMKIDAQGRTHVKERSTHARPSMHMQQCSAVPEITMDKHRLSVQ